MVQTGMRPFLQQQLSPVRDFVLLLKLCKRFVGKTDEPRLAWKCYKIIHLSISAARWIEQSVKLFSKPVVVYRFTRRLY